jgi:hypothetical protein
MTQDDCKYFVLPMRHPAEVKMPFKRVAEETDPELLSVARRLHG